MRIAPAPALGSSTGAQAGAEAPRPNSRVVTFKTNASPDRFETQTRDPSTIPDPNEETKEGAEETQPLSPQFAALAKQRRALDVRERAIAEKEKALEQTPSGQGGGLEIARLKSDPLGVLLEAGVTYDQLTEAILASQDDGSNKVRGLEQKLKSVEESFDAKLSERDKQQKQQVLAEMGREASQLVAQGDDFELVRETRSVPKVLQLIERTFDETGEILDVPEALQLIEDELLADSLKVAGYKKVQQRSQPQFATQPQQQQRQMRTLSNRDTASVPMTPKQRALAAFQGTLKR